MTPPSDSWDYLILTASNERQASAYESQLRVRQRVGQLPEVRNAIVVADLEGKRIGSGASTLDCLVRVANAERRDPAETVESILGRLRILIIHAGGDSRRLPAYGPAGKIFVPVPGESRDGIPATLFDRLAPGFLGLPADTRASGQVVVTAGDALILFDASSLRIPGTGLTIAGCYAKPEESARHGVFCVEEGGRLRLYLQKPSLEVQRAAGAINAAGESVLDIGVMSFDADAAAAMLAAFGIAAGAGGRLEWPQAMRRRILEKGLDLYREICCALGSDATVGHFIEAARASGSKWTDAEFGEVFGGLRTIPVHVRVVPSCRFLHFGSTKQLIPSGEVLEGGTRLALNNRIGPGGRIEGDTYWVEGCRVEAPLRLAGQNVVIGVDVVEPLALPVGACLDVLAGNTEAGERVWFVRPHGIDDTFKHPAGRGGTFCGHPIEAWLGAIGMNESEVWDEATQPGDRTLWNARVFPAVDSPEEYRAWLWYFDPGRSTTEQRRAFRAARRYSAAEVAWLADQDGFHARRAAGAENPARKAG